MNEAATGFLTNAELEALWLSLRISAVAVAAAMPFALGIALLLARTSFPGKILLDGIVLSPLVLPPVVMGYLLLITFGTRAPIGAWLLETFDIRLVFHWTGAALAAAIISFPFQVRAIRLSIEAIDPGLDAAAETLGAGAIDRFINITLPLALPGIIAGAITAFAASLGEFGAIITSFRTFPARRARCRSRSTPQFRHRAAKRRPPVSLRSRSRSH